MEEVLLPPGRTSWELTEEEKRRIRLTCPECGSRNLDALNPAQDGNGHLRCYDCMAGPFWWLKTEAEINAENPAEPLASLFKEVKD